MQFRQVNIHLKMQLILFILFILLTPCISLHALEETTIIKVVDGDTLRIEYQGQKETIKLIGIDAPENKLNRKAEQDAIRNNESLINIASMGIDAANYSKSLIKKGDTATIEFDVQARDKYNRMLGYIYLSDGRMLNEEMLAAGYAYLKTDSVNVKYQDRFLKAFKEAKENKRGLWK
jgi:micrococcal nuclease